ncbi:cell division protein FtsQ/DivIB [Halalkalibacter sp. APA_J-10(15)]|uniref:cell division protein FtsQ/DivIB n=1 Tax=unclassified Halalkalibacter TaxID=2893063 RepID=UPI001FF67B6C|nr:FtsQ-type POTRA domain-containing protein [Halalkalibacter sp. APA_J-10(15)]MCK0470666.1 FtsQ-type POTRA domain-containing protein [Halalkalibacter sp. APA_J-10(15)]
MSDEKVVTINEKIPTLREQRKQRANRRLLFFLSFFFMLLLLIVYFQSPASHVREVTVDGNIHLTHEEVLHQSTLQIGTSIWNVDEDDIVNRLNEHIEISSAYVERRWPTTVEITISEHERVGYLVHDDRYYPILDNGMNLSELNRSHIPADAPILVGFTEGADLSELSAELRQLPNALLERISEIIYSPTEQDAQALIMYMTDGIEVHTTINDFHEKVIPYLAIINDLDTSKRGILHLQMSPYFEEWVSEEDEEDESET